MNQTLDMTLVNQQQNLKKILQQVIGLTSGDNPFRHIDKWGNMVTATPSGGWLQSSPIIQN